MNFPQIVHHTEAASAAVSASREKAAVGAAHALAIALDKANEARGEAADIAAKLAEVESQLAALAEPNDDLAAVTAWRQKKDTLADMIALRRRKLATAEENVKACDADVDIKRAALRKALAELDAPVLDSLADLPKLKIAAEKARVHAEKTATIYEETKTAGAGALAAFEALFDLGADQEMAARILQDRKQARAKIGAARAESSNAESEAGLLAHRVNALDRLADRERRFGLLEAGVSRLENQIPALGDVAKRYEEIAAQLASLRATCGAYVRSYVNVCARFGSHGEGNGKFLMLAPEFEKSLLVPALSRDDAFLSTHWTHDYGQFDVRQDILAPLIETLGGGNPDLHHSRQIAAQKIGAEYDRLAWSLVDCAAIFLLWLIEREKLFADAGDAAMGDPRPAYPLEFRGGENRFWYRLSLPSFYKKGEFIWNPEWKAGRLIELTRASKAA